MRKLKRLVAFALCLVILSSSLITIAFSETASVMFTNITANEYSLIISGINSTSTARVSAARSMPLSIKMELQKIKSGTYTTIETWTASRTSVTLSMCEDRLINILATYRLKFACLHI